MFVPDRPFQPSLMFLYKARSLLRSGEHNRWLVLGRLRPYKQTFDWAEKTCMEKHSSLLQKMKNTDIKNIGPMAERYKTFYGHNQQILVVR